MRSLHILFILVVVTWLGFPLRAQEAISIGTRHTLFSHVLNEAREYWVYVPATRPGEKEESYPVLYLLDGDSFFHSVVGFYSLVFHLQSFFLTALYRCGCPEYKQNQRLYANLFRCPA